jgi:hypothetical protein
MLNVTKYGLASSDLPSLLLEEIRAFKAWETNGVQLDRGGLYVKRVQQPTVDNHECIIKAYMGFVWTAYQKEKDKLSLCLYQDANLFLSFVSFLKERDVSRTHLLHHVGLANKINAYIQSTVTNDAHVKHCKRMQTWLTILASQLTNIVAMPTKTAPSLKKIWVWVDSLTEGALQVVSGMMPDVLQVQAAIITMLVTGRECPPCR